MPDCALEQNMSTISSQLEWEVEHIVADDEGCRFYLDRYKPFRLDALKQDPDGRFAQQLSYIAREI